MKISGFLKQTLIDFSGQIACVVFARGCNYNCPSCHAKHIIEGKDLISEEEIFSYLDSTKGFIDGVVICGGEPTCQHDLGNFAGKLKKRGLAVKLDTNGKNYDALAEIIEEKLVDYISMDIKGPPAIYSELVGRDIDLREDIEKAMGIVQYAPDYEFRTTMAPVIRDGKISFMTPEEITSMAEWIKRSIWTMKEPKHYLQRFVARKKEEMLDERFSTDNLPKEYQKTPDEVMSMAVEAGKKAGYNFIIR